MGLVVNRPTDIPPARVFPKLKARPARLYLGGPVSTTGVFGLLRASQPTGDYRHIVEDVYLVAERSRLEPLLPSAADGTRFRLYLGYAGWGPRQLERETAQGAWHVLQADSALIFDPDPESVWPRLIRLTGGLLASARPEGLGTEPRTGNWHN